MSTTSSASVTDRIEKKVVLRVPRARVWRAISDVEQFGKWFRAKLDAPFVAGQTVRGQSTYPGYEGKPFEMQVERIDPEHYLAFRWHPYAVDPSIDYSKEPTTLVEFRLDDVSDGTQLTVIESGFDRIPLSRRAEAFQRNDGGWTEQMRSIERYVTES
jgi:uncharacterized protein YndB with AHSA1/START domain